MSKTSELRVSRLSNCIKVLIMKNVTIVVRPNDITEIKKYKAMNFPTAVSLFSLLQCAIRYYSTVMEIARLLQNIV